MAYIFSYDILEEKIKEIKNDVENLCFVVDQLMRGDVKQNEIQDSRKHYFSSVVDQEIEDEGILCRNDDSRSQSLSSYYTAVSDLSSDTFVSALENFDEDGSQKIYDYNPSTMNESLKKSVSFSNNVTILQIFHKKCKKRKVKTKINNVKNKIVGYIYQEKFLLKYNWQKIKNNIFKSISNNFIRNDENQRDEKITFSDKILEENKFKVNALNLQTFFNENVDNYILETDIDHDSIPLVSRTSFFPQTDLSSPILNRKQFPNLIGNSKENNPVIQRIKNKSIIEPKLINFSQDQPSINAVEDNAFYQYLVSKAQYPIQLKVAHSIIKLNIPVWYQSSLIA